MQISFDAKGTAREVDQQILEQMKREKVANKDSGAVIAAVRDEVRRHIATGKDGKPVPEDTPVTVKAMLTIETTIGDKAAAGDPVASGAPATDVIPSTPPGGAASPVSKPPR